MDPTTGYYYDLNSFQKIKEKFYLHTHYPRTRKNLGAKFNLLFLY